MDASLHSQYGTQILHSSLCDSKINFSSPRSVPSSSPSVERIRLFTTRLKSNKIVFGSNHQRLISAVGGRNHGNEVPNAYEQRAQECVIEVEISPMSENSSSLKVSPGQAFPLGASEVERGINFSLFSQHASAVTLCLLVSEGKKLEELDAGMVELNLDSNANKTGDRWHICVENLPREGVLYGYRIDGSKGWKQGHRFDSSIVLLDPYAKLVEGRKIFGDTSHKMSKFLGTYDFSGSPFDWGNNYKQPNIPEKDLVVYEMNVRAFTADKSSSLDPDIRGSYLGVIERIPHRLELGINAVELLPVFEFDELELQRRSNPRDHMINTWGYSTINFFAPMSRYATAGGEPVAASCEFKQMVKALHDAGIEVILDVVYNHTNEADDANQYTTSFRGIDNKMLKVDCRPNRATYEILINGLCKDGKPEDARQLFDEMEHRGISPDTMIYTIIISGLCQANKTDDAHKLLHSMKSNSCLPDIITYNALLSGFCKLNKIDESLKLLDSFRKEGYVLGLNGYSCLIDGLFRVGRFDEACEWYRMMLKEDIVPDCKLYTVLIKGFTRVGRVEEALNFLSEMSQKGVVPDTFCYNTLIQGFCDVGLLDKARSLKLEISTNNCFPDSATYTILICGLCKEGLVGEAKQIFNDMENIGCLPTVMTFNALIDGLCKAGELEDARLLFYKMEIGRNPSLFLRLSQGADRVLDSESLHKMVDQLCKSGLMLKAYKLLRQLADSGVVPNITTYNILINGLCKAGKIDGALKLVYDLQVKGYNPDVVTYATLIDGYQRANREEAALRLFNQMEKLGCTPSLIIYNTLMTYMCRKGKLSQAFSLWLKYLRGLPDRDNGDLTVVEKKFERGEIEAAVRGLLEIDMKYKAVEPALYTVWLIGLCQAGKLDEAWKVFNVLEDGKIDATPPSCVILINGLCGAQKVDLAVNVMLYTLEKGFKLMQPVCNRLIRFLYSQDNAMGVLDLVSRMSSAGYDVDAYLYHSSKVIVNRCMQRQEIRKRALVI